MQKSKPNSNLLNFQSTANIPIPKRLVDQIIGQDEAVTIIKKAAKQRRNVLLIGEPGTGKSLTGQALAELLPNETLVDILSLPNTTDENAPLIKPVPKGKGKELVQKARLQAMSSLRSQNIIFFILVILSVITPWWVRKEYGDIMAAASMIGSMIFLASFVLFMNLNRRAKLSAMVPKLLIDNSSNKKAPFLDACLLPGQKVFTNPAPVKIEDTSDKFVYNARGIKQRVIKVERIPWRGKVYNIKPRLIFPLKATQNHPFLVLERPETKQFKLREFRRICKNLNKHIKWKRAEELTRRHLLIYPELKHPTEYQKINIKDKRNTIPETIIVDEEIGEIFGWYLAEGYVRVDDAHQKGIVGFTLGNKEMKDVKRLKQLIKRRFNLPSTIDTHTGHSIELLVYSRSLSKFFKETYNSGAKNKIIPRTIFESPKSVKLAFLDAYFKGDGWEGKDALSVATTSKELAEDIIFFFSSLGILPTSSQRKMKDSKINGRKIAGPYIYEFTVGGRQLRKLGRKKGKFQHYFSKDNLNFIPIKKVWAEDYEGEIVNMETEDGTYLMPCITHNTGSHAGALLGDVLHDPLQSGGLGTPAYERLVPGIIHKANKGVLFCDEIGNLTRHSQQELLTAMQEKKYPITGQSERSSGAMVRSDPAPTDFILVAAGTLETVQKMHPALRSRIRGYGYEVNMNTMMDDLPENCAKLAVFVAQEVHKDKKIPHFAREAVEEIIQEARVRAGTSGKLTLRLRELGGLVRAAGDLALEEKSKYVQTHHVIKAKILARTLEQQIVDKYIENKKKYEVIITQGHLIGRVNGLAVMGSDSYFSGIVLPIESEVTPGGKKTEFVATGKLGEIAKEAVKNVSAIILKHFGEDIKEKYDVFVQFLQTASEHGGVEGDSASIAVATAIISALKQIPVRQDTALTGSLSVRGEVLAVGGITQKVEAAIQAGISRAIIPKANEKDVLLPPEKKRKIKIITASTIQEVLKEALVWKGKESILKKIMN